MAWTEGFDPLARIWCRGCGSGDTIQGKRTIRKRETFLVDDIDSPDSNIDWIEEDVEATEYHCTVCGIEGEEIHDIATDNQNEGREAFNRNADSKVNHLLKKEGFRVPNTQWSHNDEEYYPDYEED